MKNSVKKAAVTALVCVTAAGMMAGCGNKKLDGTKTAVTINKENQQKLQESLLYIFNKKDKKITGILKSKFHDYNIRAKIESLKKYEKKKKKKSKSKTKKSENKNISDDENNKKIESRNENFNSPLDKNKDFFKKMEVIEASWVWWLTPVIPALWEAEAGRSPEVWSSRPA